MNVNEESDTLLTILKKNNLTREEFVNINPFYNTFNAIIPFSISAIPRNESKFIITYEDTIKLGWPNDSGKVYDQIQKASEAFHIYYDLAHFLSQAAVFSNFGQTTIEDSILPTYLDANKSIGNKDPGDGYKFRKAGILMTGSGRKIYQEFASYVHDQQVLERGAEYVSEQYPWLFGGYIWSQKLKVGDYISRNPDINPCDVTKIIYGSKIHCHRVTEEYQRVS